MKVCVSIIMFLYLMNNRKLSFIIIFWIFILSRFITAVGLTLNWPNLCERFKKVLSVMVPGSSPLDQDK